MSLHTALEDLSYPCAYPFKLICLPEAVAAVQASITQTIGDQTRILETHQRASRSGKYVALTLTINAQSAAQIEGVYAALASVTGIVTSL